jgi:class 3 adenylate cyclase/CHASE2 domain-containing sensor protein
VKFKRLKRTPLLIALSVLALVATVSSLHLDFPERLERMTYDLRVRAARKFPAPAATNLAFVAMEDSSIAALRHGLLGQPYGLYWPRHVYGRVVEELSAQGAQAVAFDVLFGERRPDHAPVQMADGTLMESDQFFALQMRRAGNVISAFTAEVNPPDLFVTNSLALGDISTAKDTDGVLRQIKSFNLKWHPAFKSAAHQLGADLERAEILPDRIILPLAAGTNLTVALDRDGNFDLADFMGDDLPKNFKRFDKPFERVWDLGIVLAAQALNLNLARAEVDLPGGKIVLRSADKKIERVIPVDEQGFFFINWQLTVDNPAIVHQPIEEVLKQDKLRLTGETNLPSPFRGKLVVLGSAAQGNDLSDHGATPLENDTLLVSKHWNVANSVITNQFIRRAAPAVSLALIILLGLATALLTWQLRAVAATVATALLVTGYTALAFWIFIKFRLWLPLVFPVAGAIFIEHISLVSYRVVFEEREQRRVKSVFSKIVSPAVVNELLGAEKLSLGGTRRDVSVFFADVRGFTTLTDQMQEQVAEFVRANKLDSVAAEKCFDESARETLETVNLYLAAVADAVKKHGGTLDKYIGDCVMAFWNAPIPDENHAAKCVSAAREAQRTIYELNQERLKLNAAREIENRARASAGLPPKPILVALQLGTGINTGSVTVGLMGSDQHILNYTVFGREVNLASRLEGVSGSGRIIISETTYHHLCLTAPELAAQCVALPPEKVKGIREAVKIFEVPWK